MPKRTSAGFRHLSASYGARALAEAAALLVLRSRGDLGQGRGRMISPSGRQQAVELIDEARQTGARLKPACRELGINARTYQRWTQTGQLATDVELAKRVPRACYMVSG
jgi:hypothetical protein